MVLSLTKLLKQLLRLKMTFEHPIFFFTFYSIKTKQKHIIINNNKLCIAKSFGVE